MFNRNYSTAALLALLCANAFALDYTFLIEAPVPQSDVMAGASVVVAPLPVSSVRTLVIAAPTAAEVRARGLQTWLTRVNKPYANQLGTGNGAGVTIGLVDSGVQTDHPVLKGQISATYNAFTGSTDATDQMGHGDHVAGILAGTTANGGITEGIAPGAKLVVAKVFTTGSSPTSVIEVGVNWVVNVQKAPILALSLGAASESMKASIQNAVAKGTLISVALGNGGKTDGATWPAEFAKEAWAKGQIVAVGALDANNTRASFSNSDPTLANWTVYAPGVNVLSSYSNPTYRNAYAYSSGTSMSQPMVAGQMALIKSNWNFLTAPEIAKVIFQSATHLCSDTATAAVCLARKTPDAMYGWGLINVGASLQPIGGLNVATASGAKVSYMESTIATPKSGLAPGLKGLNTIAVDKFNRGFVVNLGTGLK